MRTEIPAREGDIGGFTQLSVNLAQQRLKRIKVAASAQAALGGSRQQIDDDWLAAMGLRRLDELG
jgi:hypothetical protein